MNNKTFFPRELNSVDKGQCIIYRSGVQNNIKDLRVTKIT